MKNITLILLLTVNFISTYQDDLKHNSQKNIVLLNSQNLITPKSEIINSYLSQEKYLLNPIIKPFNSSDLSTFGMKTYFQNLYKYSPSNTIGTCGFVSLSQYLSYFDTFYNDDIIPAKYDRTETNSTSISKALSISPGVQRLDLPSANVENFVNQNYNSDFQSYLIKTINNKNQSSTYQTSIGMWDYHYLLEALIPTNTPSYTTIRVKDYGDPRNNSVKNIAKNLIKNKLNEKKPVIIHIANINDNGDYEDYHSVVAYYYDSNGIHCNFGWGSTSTDLILDENYEITEVGYLDDSSINLTHSKNYYLNGLKYCGCGKHIFHTYSKHSNLNKINHTAYCNCGYSIIEPHYKLAGHSTGNKCYACGEVCNFLFEKEPDED